MRGPSGSLLTLSPLQNRVPVGAVVCMSGAPFIWVSGGQVIPQGVLVGGFGSCGAGGTSWFTPIWPVLSAHGLILYTG